MPQRLFDRTHPVSRTQFYSHPTSLESRSRQHEVNYSFDSATAPRPSTSHHFHARPDMTSSSTSDSALIADNHSLWLAHSKRPAPKDEKAATGSTEEGGALLRPPMKIARTMSSSCIETHTPPDNFAHVAGFVYRSSFPQPENFEYLKKLGLKSILTLVPDPYSEHNAEFLRENGITHFQISMPGNKETSVTPVTDEKISAALRIILDRRNHPMLIHCNKGKHRTGTVIGCLRRFQAWSVSNTLKEYRRFAGIKSRPHDQMKIETYNIEACLDVAREHKWIPSTRLTIESDDEGVDTPLSTMGLMAIKAQ